MDTKGLNLLRLLELPPPIYFSFTDPFIQEYYQYSLDELEYFLKISLLLGSHIEITAANLWQSAVSMKLFNSALVLFEPVETIGKEVKQPLIRLATREYSNNSKVFSTYFNQRLEEREHFIALPDALMYLDFQLPETLKVARHLDNIVKPYARKGGNVTELYTEYIMTHFSNHETCMIYDKLLSYKELNSVSRATVADCILSMPLINRRQEQLVLDANEIYFRANAAATKAQLIYPNKKYRLAITEPDKTHLGCSKFEFIDSIMPILNSVGLTTNTMKSISFKAFYFAQKYGVLDNIKRYIWLLRINEKNNTQVSFLSKNFYGGLCKKSVSKLIGINKDVSLLSDLDLREYEIDMDIDEITPKKIFHFKLNRTLYFGGVKKMEEQKIKISTLIEECNSKLRFDELKIIAVEIFEDYELISHSNKLEFVRELCLECKRKGKLEEFVLRCMKYNPNFTILSLNLSMPTNIVDWRGSDSVGEQISTEFQEKIIGARHRFQSIAFLQQGFELSKRVCMLVNNGRNTGFRASCFLVNREYLITNKHVINSKEVAENTEIWFNYEESTNRQLQKYKLYGQEAVISDKYDIALCRINYDSKPEFLESFPKVQFGKPNLDDIVPIIQHPNGWPKQICIGHNSLRYINSVRIQYLTDTMPGSSGSPVFDSSWNLIGLHSCGGLIVEPRTGNKFFRNEGIHVDVIKEFLEENGVELI